MYGPPLSASLMRVSLAELGERTELPGDAGFILGFQRLAILPQLLGLSWPKLLFGDYVLGVRS